IQDRCLQLATQATECRFDPDFNSDADPVRFPRESQLSGTGSILFNENTGLLTVEDVQITGEPPTYNLSLQVNHIDGERFDVTTVEESGNISDWEPGARYFADESLLYLPSLQVSPPRPGSNRFDVYLEYATDGQQQWLRLLEYEQIP
ncbi:MAG: hypothetical protein KJN90_00730, partial [Gammaproteobacteria bacterium]|nr:hypothetical protein [Gammaproteobacteria bacterium]